MAFAFANNKSIREVQTRYLAKAAGAPETPYSVWRDPSDSGRFWHWAGSISDPSNAIRGFIFEVNPGAWADGLLIATNQEPVGSPSLKTLNYYWAQDAAGNPYVSSVITTLEAASSSPVQSKVEQTVDTHGNVTQTKIYDFGNLSTPVRTYNNTYLTDGNYTSRNVWNRLVTSTLTSGGKRLRWC